MNVFWISILHPPYIHRSKNELLCDYVPYSTASCSPIHVIFNDNVNRLHVNIVIKKEQNLPQNIYSVILRPGAIQKQETQKDLLLSNNLANCILILLMTCNPSNFSLMSLCVQAHYRTSRTISFPVWASLFTMVETNVCKISELEMALADTARSSCIGIALMCPVTIHFVTDYNVDLHDTLFYIFETMNAPSA